MGVAQFVVARVLAGVVVSVLVSTAAVAQTSIPDVPIGPGAAEVAIVPVGGSASGGSGTVGEAPRGLVWWSVVPFVPSLHARILPVFRPSVATLRESRGRVPLGRLDLAGRRVRR